MTGCPAYFEYRYHELWKAELWKGGWIFSLPRGGKRFHISGDTC
jgi:hypothetical protein